MTNSRDLNYPLMKLLVVAVINAKLSGFRQVSHPQAGTPSPCVRRVSASAWL